MLENKPCSKTRDARFRWGRIECRAGILMRQSTRMSLMMLCMLGDDAAAVMLFHVRVPARRRTNHHFGNKYSRKNRHRDRRINYQADVASMTCTLLTPSIASTSCMMARTSASCNEKSNLHYCTMNINLNTDRTQSPLGHALRSNRSDSAKADRILTCHCGWYRTYQKYLQFWIC
jgi:hypothetical protein